MLLPLPPAVPFREGTAGMTLLFITRFTVWAVPRKCAGTIRHFYSCLCLCCLFFSLCLFLRCFLAVNWSVIFCRQGCLKFAVQPVAFMLNDNVIILVPLENQAWKKQTWLIELAKRKSPCFSSLNCVWHIPWACAHICSGVQVCSWSRATLHFKVKWWGEKNKLSVSIYTFMHFRARTQLHIALHLPLYYLSSKKSFITTRIWNFYYGWSW